MTEELRTRNDVRIDDDLHIRMDGGSDGMDWWAWALIGVGGLALLAVSREIPAIRRYWKMKAM